MYPGFLKKGMLLGNCMPNFIWVARLESCQKFGNYRLEVETRNCVENDFESCRIIVIAAGACIVPIYFITVRIQYIYIHMNITILYHVRLRKQQQ